MRSDQSATRALKCAVFEGDFVLFWASDEMCPASAHPHLGRWIPAGIIWVESADRWPRK